MGLILRLVLLFSLPVAFHLLVFHDGVLLGVVGSAVAVFLADLVGRLIAGLSRLENTEQGIREIWWQQPGPGGWSWNLPSQPEE